MSTDAVTAAAGSDSRGRGATRLRELAERALFSIDLLVLFLLLFEHRVQLPAWLQVIGRMHPLVLHFPIVLLLGIFGLRLISARTVQRWTWFPPLLSFLMLVAALAAAVTVLMGVLLSHEPGYGGSDLTKHKWLGVAVMGIASAIYWTRSWKQPDWARRIVSVAGVAVVVLAGHLGAAVTHGKDFLMAPLAARQREVPLDQAVVYQHIVRPILESKCASCHNADKAKADLILTSLDGMMKGGRSGRLWVAGLPDTSLLIDRIELPVEAKQHMPPAGKPALTAEEIAILRYWIRDSASATRKLLDLRPTDSLRVFATDWLDPGLPEPAVYRFDQPDSAIVRRLDGNDRRVQPIASGSPALTVTFYNPSRFDPAALRELLPLKEQIIELRLTRMPVTNTDLAVVAEFANLRVLNLDFSAITGAGLATLAPLHHLHRLTLDGTRITRADLATLATLPALREVYAWSTPLAADSSRPDTTAKLRIVYGGAPPDEGRMKLSPPRLDNPLTVLDDKEHVSLVHTINGVQIRYTLDGSVPDSNGGKLYGDSLPFAGAVTLIARAFKPGWEPSDTMRITLFRTRYRPDSVVLLAQPASEYADNALGKTILFDRERGELGDIYGGAKWLGYRDHDFEVEAHFSEMVTVGSVNLGYLLYVGFQAFPPTTIEVWGGTDARSMKLLGRQTMRQPDSMATPAEVKTAECRFSPAKVRVLKIVARRVPKLPPWHYSKGKPGMVMIDEIMIN